jgi:hypothetical protein
MVSADMMSSSYVQNYPRVVSSPLFTKAFLFVVPMSVHTGCFGTVLLNVQIPVSVIQFGLHRPAADRSRQMLAIIADPENFQPPKSAYFSRVASFIRHKRPLEQSLDILLSPKPGHIS